ncbi:MAG: hypothetical protein U5K54_06085 [Cytophagales bacterium]|nr:hypothetical protein [Cytophagales bacterium]
MRQQFRHLKNSYIPWAARWVAQQVLEWAILQPEVFDRIIPIATNAIHSPWGIAFNEAQRMAIEADATWKEEDARRD